jgi:hypothetical protein
MKYRTTKSKSSIENRITRNDVESLVHRLADGDVVAITGSKDGLDTGNLFLTAYGVTSNELSDEIYQTCQELSEGASPHVVVETSLYGVNTLDGFLLYADEDVQDHLEDAAPQMSIGLDNFCDEFVQQIGV